MDAYQLNIDASEIRVRETSGSTLVMSMRGIENLVAYSMCYEFEDVLCRVTGADRVCPSNYSALNRARFTYRLGHLLTGSARLGKKLSVSPPLTMLTRQYDLFFPIFNHPYELHTLLSVPDWRDRSRLAACFIGEAFSNLLPPYLMQLLAEFDHIFVGSRTAAQSVAIATGRPCTYLPFASDVVGFSPVPEFPVRDIDVCNVGRRSEITHDALMRLAMEKKIFYYYDTVASSGVDQRQRTFRIQDAGQHRLLLGNILKRSRYYIANRSRANEPDLIKDRQEISGRFYEGAAAGAVLIGQPPECDDFAEQFNWPDALIRTPFDAPDIAAAIRDLDSNPERLTTIRRQNISNAAAKHDWLNRIEKVFDTLGLEHTAGMRARRQQLRQIAQSALAGPM